MLTQCLWLALLSGHGLQEPGSANPPVVAFVEWARQVRPPYSLNATYETTTLDLTEEGVGTEALATLNSWIDSIRAGSTSIEHDQALRAYWLWRQAGEGRGETLITQFHHRDSGDAILDLRRLEGDYYSAMLLAEGLSVSFASGLNRVRVAADRPALRRLVTDPARVLYPLLITDYATRSYLEGLWRSRVDPAGNWRSWQVTELPVSEKLPSGQRGFAALEGRARSPIPELVLIQTSQGDVEHFVLAFVVTTSVERGGLGFPFPSEILLFDTISRSSTLELRRVLLGDVSFNTQLQMQLPVRFLSNPILQDARAAPTRTYGPDVVEWPADVLRFLRDE
jgi:hypothetical protein